MRTLKKRWSVVALLFISLATKAQNIENLMQSNGKNCIGLKDHDGWSVGVYEPGDYCVAQNLRQTWPLIRLPHQPAPRDPLIKINSSNVKVDLMERHLSAKISSGLGIWVNQSGFFINREGNHPYYSMKISNGKISTTEQVTVFMVHAWNRENKRFDHRRLSADTFAVAGSLADSHGDLTQYRPTEYTLENLTLEADNHVIIMQGKKNIIRRCKIIGGNGTVNVYGPNLIFEDNEIILNAKDPQKEGDEPAVALYLEDAADSIVRNNRITIKGHAAKTDAIVLKNSPNVQIEGNTIKGTNEVYRLLDERSSVVDKANTATR
jgi:hypothetical protein